MRVLLLLVKLSCSFPEKLTGKGEEVGNDGTAFAPIFLLLEVYNAVGEALAHAGGAGFNDFHSVSPFYADWVNCPMYSSDSFSTCFFSCLVSLRPVL